MWRRHSPESIRSTTKVHQEDQGWRHCSNIYKLQTKHINIITITVTITHQKCLLLAFVMNLFSYQHARHATHLQQSQQFYLWRDYESDSSNDESYDGHCITVEGSNILNDHASHRGPYFLHVSNSSPILTSRSMKATATKAPIKPAKATSPMMTATIDERDSVDSLTHAPSRLPLSPWAKSKSWSRIVSELKN